MVRPDHIEQLLSLPADEGHRLQEALRQTEDRQYRLSRCESQTESALHVASPEAKRCTENGLRRLFMDHFFALENRHFVIDAIGRIR